MSYEAGFAQGEHDSFHDRRRGVRRELHEAPATTEERGYWDAYSPRSPTWDSMQRTPFFPMTFDQLPTSEPA